MAPRIPPLPREGRDPRTEDLLAGLRRPDGSELNIFAALAHHPRLLKRWSAFGGTLLYTGTLSPRERELLILRTALHCGAHYEWGQHVAIALAAGVSQAEVDRVAAGPEADGGRPTTPRCCGPPTSSTRTPASRTPPGPCSSSALIPRS